MEQDHYGSVEVGAVSSPQLSSLQGALARPHLLDRPPEHSHDVTEVHGGRSRVRVLIH